MNALKRLRAHLGVDSGRKQVGASAKLDLLRAVKRAQSVCVEEAVEHQHRKETVDVPSSSCRCAAAGV